MVTMIPGGQVNEYRGTSNDTKPITHVPNGSVFLEVDTCDVYFFDEATHEWIKG